MRIVVGIIVGIVAWWLLFMLTLIGLSAAWPALAEAGRRVQESGDFGAISAAMLAMLLATYVYINGIAGWSAGRIARRWSAVWIAATPVFAYAVFQHLFRLWGDLPAWYNLGVVAFVYPFSLMGGRLALRRV